MKDPFEELQHRDEGLILQAQLHAGGDKIHTINQDLHIYSMGVDLLKTLRANHIPLNAQALESLKAALVAKQTMQQHLNRKRLESLPSIDL